MIHGPQPPTKTEIDLDIPVEDGWIARRAAFNAEAGKLPATSVITFENPDEGYFSRAELDLPSGKFSEMDEASVLPVSRNINQSRLYAEAIAAKIMKAVHL